MTSEDRALIRACRMALAAQRSEDHDLVQMPLLEAIADKPDGVKKLTLALTSIIASHVPEDVLLAYIAGSKIAK